MYIINMIHENKKYNDPCVEINWNNPKIKFCKSILDLLTDKDRLFLQSYYWDGLTETQIAPLLGYEVHSTVAKYRDRVFSKVRMFSDLRLSYTPPCIKSTERHTLKGLQNPRLINKITEDYEVRAILKPQVVSLIDYISMKEMECKTCSISKSCAKKIERKHTASINSGFIESENEVPTINNLKKIQKTLSYLLDWKVYHECS